MIVNRPEDFNFYLREFEKNGMRGPINWYRNIDRNWEITKDTHPKKIPSKTCFITGEDDPVGKWAPINPDYYDNLVSSHKIKNAGHWIQQEKPDDFVVATGETHSVKEFIDLAFSHVGMTLSWHGEGVDRIAKDQNGITRVVTNPRFFRPAEVELLIGKYDKAEAALGWKPGTTFAGLVKMMVDSDVALVVEAKEHGYAPPKPPE